MRTPQKLTHGMNLFKDGMRVINEIIDYLNSSRIIGDSSTIAINETIGGVQIKMIKKQSSGGGSAASAAYSGPFAVITETVDDTQALILSGYNADKGRLHRNYIDIGLDTPIEVAETTLELSASGWVWIKITYDTAYIAEVFSGSEFPAQTATELYIRIAYVTFKDSKVETITQYQYGGIILPGRIF